MRLLLREKVRQGSEETESAVKNGWILKNDE
jgi:hypothetical protein